MQNKFNLKWLQFIILIVVVVAGLVLAMASHPTTSLPSVWFIDLVFWPFDGTQSLAAPETRILSAILGGILVGWGVLLLQILRKLYPTNPTLAKQLITNSVLCWLLVDSLGSITAGAPVNAILNLVLCAMILLPLHFAKRKVL